MKFLPFMFDNHFQMSSRRSGSSAAKKVYEQNRLFLKNNIPENQVGRPSMKSLFSKNNVSKKMSGSGPRIVLIAMNGRDAKNHVDS